jgi:hypothetical protein
MKEFGLVNGGNGGSVYRKSTGTRPVIMEQRGFSGDSFYAEDYHR